MKTKTVELKTKTTWTLDDAELCTLIRTALQAPSNAEVEFDIRQSCIYGVTVTFSETQPQEPDPELTKIQIELMKQADAHDGIEVQAEEWIHLDGLITRGFVHLSGARGPGRKFRRLMLTEAGTRVIRAL